MAESFPDFRPNDSSNAGNPPSAQVTGAGDASAANQAVEASLLGQINTKLGSALTVVFPSAQPVSGISAVTEADGANVNAGSTTDTAVTTDANGTLSGKLRGLVKLIASVITGGKVAVDPSGVTSPVSGTVSVANFPATQPVSGTVAVSSAATTVADGANVSVGAKADTAASSDTGTFSLISLIKRELQTLATIAAKTTVQIYSPANVAVASAAYENARVITASAGKVMSSLTGFNSKNAAQWIQLHDSATAPADTAVPLLIFYVLANDNFNIPVNGLKCANGWYVCNSTTGPTKTLGAADCWFNARIEN